FAPVNADACRCAATMRDGAASRGQLANDILHRLGVAALVAGLVTLAPRWSGPTRQRAAQWARASCQSVRRILVPEDSFRRPGRTFLAECHRHLAVGSHAWADPPQAWLSASVASCC